MKIYYETRSAALHFNIVSTLSPLVHLHKEFEIIHVIEGTAVAYADANSYLLAPGDTFISFPNQVHYYKCNAPGRFVLGIFSADLIHGSKQLLSDSIPDKNMLSSAQEPALLELFQKMTGFPEEQHALILIGCLNIMLGLMLPHFKLSQVGYENNTSLYNIIKFCSHNFREDISLDTLSEKLHLSKYYISHLINQKLGQNFNEYLNNLRIGEACLLLRETDKKIADISEDVGFGTLRSFNRAFKHIMGISPALYREQNRFMQDFQT